VLSAILRDPMCAPLSVRQRLGIHRSTLTSVLDRLERDGRILRPASDFNGQRFELILTPSGRIAAHLAEYSVRAVDEEIATYTSRRERKSALAVFQACAAVDRPDRPIGS